MKFPLIVSDADEAYERDEAVIESFPILWDPKYQDDFRLHSVKTAIRRGEETIKGPLRKTKLREAGMDVVLTLQRVEPKNVHLRGDYRYSSEKMAEFLCNTDLDLIPPIVGRTASGTHLLDGHHRWRAYLLAGIDPLIMLIEIEKSRTSTPQIITHVNTSHLKRPDCNPSRWEYS